MTYLRHVGVALTQLLNAVLGGWPDESLSSRLWRLEQWAQHGGAAYARRAVDALFWLQDGHCRLSYLAERKRYAQPPLLRQQPPERP